MIVDESTFERLAALEHDRWSGWMKYMIQNLTVLNLMKWLGQMEGLYDDLSEAEKEGHRKQVRRTLKILGADVGEIPQQPYRLWRCECGNINSVWAQRCGNCNEPRLEFTDGIHHRVEILGREYIVRTKGK